MTLFFGILFLIGALLLFSLSGWEKKNRRVHTLRFLCALVRGIRTGVADYCTPLPRILSSFPAEGEERAFLDDLAAVGAEAALSGHAEALAMAEEDRQAVLDFFSAFTVGYRKTVTSLCDGFLAELSGRLEGLEPRLRPELRLALLLPVAFGTLILLLIL